MNLEYFILFGSALLKVTLEKKNEKKDADNLNTRSYACGPRGGRPDCANGSCGPRGGRPDCANGSCGPRGGGSDCANGSCGSRGGRSDCADGSCGPRGGRSQCADGSCGSRGGRPDCADGSCGPRGGRPDCADGSCGPRGGRSNYQNRCNLLSTKEDTKKSNLPTKKISDKNEDTKLPRCSPDCEDPNCEECKELQEKAAEDKKTE